MSNSVTVEEDLRYRQTSDSESNIIKTLMGNLLESESIIGHETEKMKTRTMLIRKPHKICTFEGECDFRKMIAKKDRNQSKTRCAICTWKDQCNQQIGDPEAIRAKLIYPI